MRGNVYDRFTEKCVLADTGCIIWEGTRDPNGYGRFSFRNKLWYAHRVAWEIFKGEIPFALVVDHLCVNRACVNVDHLEPVTLAMNSSRGVLGWINRELIAA